MSQIVDHSSNELRRQPLSHLSPFDKGTGSIGSTASVGSTASLATAFQTERSGLRKTIARNLDSRLRGRVDPSDVLQDTYIEAFRSFEKYSKEPPMSVKDWLRFLAKKNALTANRTHIQVLKRDATREVPGGQAQNEIQQVLNHESTPSQKAIKKEHAEIIGRFLNQLPVIDREVLVLRHFEQLSNKQVAERLNLSKRAASKRYIRAIERLTSVWKSADPT